MRTHEELLAEIALRKALGLPRIELTLEEKARAFGDTAWAKRDPYARQKELVERMQQGLPLTIKDRRDARRYLKELQGAAP